MRDPTRPRKPEMPPFEGLPRIPVMTALQQRRQWVAWGYVWKPNPKLPDGGKWTKPPVNPHTGQFASVSALTTWGTYQEAVERAQADRLPGVGYVLTADDDVIGIDIDDCRDKIAGTFA